MANCEGVCVRWPSIDSRCSKYLNLHDKVWMKLGEWSLDERTESGDFYAQCSLANGSVFLACENCLIFGMDFNWKNEVEKFILEFGKVKNLESGLEKDSRTLDSWKSCNEIWQQIKAQLNSINNHKVTIWPCANCRPRQDKFILYQSVEEIAWKVRARGGKGGFGANLKRSGGRMAKKSSTNVESSRDLQGRRIRDLHTAKRLADALQKQPELEKQRQERLQAKIREGLAAAEKLHSGPKKLMDGKIFDKMQETREQVRASIAEAMGNNQEKTTKQTQSDKSKAFKEIIEAKKETMASVAQKPVQPILQTAWDEPISDDEDDDE